LTSHIFETIQGRYSCNAILIGTRTRPTQRCNSHDLGWSNLAKFSTTQSVVRHLRQLSYFCKILNFALHFGGISQSEVLRSCLLYDDERYILAIFKFIALIKRKCLPILLYALCATWTKDQCNHWTLRLIVFL